MRFQLGKVSILLASMFLITAVYAEEVNFGKEVPSKEEILHYFQAPADETDEAKSRGLVFIEKEEKQALKHKPITPKYHEKAISLEILFAYDSATLTDEGKRQLRPVGNALADETLKGLHYRIEGHTDVIGSDQYNNNLSRRRAEAVKDFLVQQFNLPASVMKIDGKGKKDLANSEDPTSEANRRVKIILLE